MDGAMTEPVVREVTCKTVLNKSKLGGYSLNCYGGCRHGCVYCYARFMQRFHPHEEAWGEYVDVKVNAVEAVARQVERLPAGEVFVSSACDGWQPIEAERQLTRECCRILVAHGFKPNTHTKSRLVLRDLDGLSGHDARVAVTVTTLDESLRRLWEPRTPPVEERFEVIAKARDAGLETGIMFGPLLPFLSDQQVSVDAMLERAADLGIDRVWVDALNPRPKVWPSVRALLERSFPELVERYQRVLFWPRVREAYRAGLRERVERAATRCRMAGRVAPCM